MQWLTNLFRKKASNDLIAYMFRSRKSYTKVKLIPVEVKYLENSLKITKTTKNTKGVIIKNGDVVTVVVEALLGKNACGNTTMAVFKIGRSRQHYMIPSVFMGVMKKENAN